MGPAVPLLPATLDNVRAVVSMGTIGRHAMKRPRILVINPNSNEAVTQGLHEALQPLAFADGPEIVCSTSAWLSMP